MKVAITADLHLKSNIETPDRYEVLEQIITSLRNQNIKDLIIAGDLFDKEKYNYNDFDALCRKYDDINFFIIPGNHDAGIEQKFFSAQNIKIFIEPTFITFDNTEFYFVPYKISSHSMDDEILKYNTKLPDKWILIGHGDYLTINKSLYEYEKEYYMPLSNKIIRELKPLKVFLGHIHKPTESDIVVYPGSPYPLNITETGKRRFLVYDIANNNVEKIYLNLNIIYMIEELLVIPYENEINKTLQKIDDIIYEWNMTDDELAKVQLRLIMEGFTNDKQTLINSVVNHIKEKKIKLYDNDSPQDNNLNVVLYKDRETIMNEVIKEINKLPEYNYASKNDIINNLLQLIYKI